MAVAPNKQVMSIEVTYILTQNGYNQKPYVFAENRIRNAHFILEDESAHSLDLYRILSLDYILKLSNIKLHECW